MLAAHRAVLQAGRLTALAPQGERLQLAARAAAPADDEDVHAELGAAVMLRLDEQRAAGIGHPWMRRVRATSRGMSIAAALRRCRGDGWPTSEPARCFWASSRATARWTSALASRSGAITDRGSLAREQFMDSKPGRRAESHQGFNASGNPYHFLTTIDAGAEAKSDRVFVADCYTWKPGPQRALELPLVDHQAQPGVVSVEPAEMAVARIPGSVGEVVAHRGYDAIDDLQRHPREPGCRVTRSRVEHAFGVRPEGHQHPVASVARDRNDVDPRRAAEPSGQFVDAREDPPVKLGDLGQVVSHQQIGRAHV